MAYDEITFVIEEEIGELSVASNGWAKEVNLVSWNGGVAKIDIRSWDETHERMSRGLTLTDAEARKLQELLNEYFG